MDKQHIKGAADKLKGGAKEVAGKATGDRRMEAEGKGDQVKGGVRQAVGNIKDAVRDATRK